jgi:hypothetical protein
MTLSRITVVIVVAVIAATAALSWVIAVPARPHAAPAAPAPAAAAPTDSTWPRYVSSPSPSTTPGQSGGPVAPPTGLAATPPTGGAVAHTADAQPFIQSFAGQPGVAPLKALPSPKQTISVAANIDGCDHAYGLPTQCVPWTFPAGTTDKCAWLAEHGYTKLRVVAADRQKLDPDGDKIACDN